MSLLSYFEDSTKMISSSPFRKLIEQEHPLLMDIFADDLKKIDGDLQKLFSKVNKPLKIVVMGEVKSGKSTLLNTLAGGEVSPINVKEATASIIEIFHQQEKQGIIVRKNAASIIGTPLEIYECLSNHHGDQEFFSQVDCVQLGFPLANLRKLHIVDTPGLNSITTVNAERTEQYTQEADVVLWVFNGNHLGQADVEESLAQVARLGKPIIGVINRVDEVDTDPFRLVMFLEQQLGIYLQHLLPLSAYQAYEGIKNSDEHLLQESGFTDLLDYLKNNIERDSEQIHVESIISSTQALLRQDLSYHDSYQRNMNFILKQLQQNRAELEYHRDRIMEKMEHRLKQWLSSEFLKHEEIEISEEIKGMNLWAGKGFKETIEQKMKTHFSEKNIHSQMDEFITLLEQEFQEEWKKSIDAIEETMKNRIEKFAEQEGNLLANALKEVMPSGQSLAWEGAGKGAAIAGAWGTTIAAYVAWLGPAASTVSIGAAVGAIVPPLLIAGAVTGAVAKIIGYSNKKKKYQQELMGVIHAIKQNIVDKAYPKIIHSFKVQSNDLINRIQDKLEDSICPSWSEQEIKNKLQQMDKYCIELQLFIQRSQTKVNV